MTTPYERLAVELVPTGTFGHAQPLRPPQPRVCPPTWTPEQQAQHRADLLAAIDDWTWDESARDAERRHLRLITNQTQTTAA